MSHEFPSPEDQDHGFRAPEEQVEQAAETLPVKVKEGLLPTAEEARKAGYRIYGEVVSRIRDAEGYWHELPEPGFMANQFWVNEDTGDAPKGKGYGQALLLATIREHGAYYSLDEKRLDPTQHVLDALERKGLITITPITVGGYPMKMLKAV